MIFSLTRENRARLTAVVIISLFTVALFLPGHQITSAGTVLRRSDYVVPGWQFARLGWAGPLELCFAWFANFPLALFVANMLRGRPPLQRSALITASLALSVLLPQLIFQPADGWHYGLFRGPAVWLWLSCFGFVLFSSKAFPAANESKSRGLLDTLPQSGHSPKAG